MSQLSNVDIAARLGISHSGVSRMRRGERVASIDILDRLVHEFGADSDELLNAAAAATRGSPGLWVELLARLFDDGVAESELAFTH